METPWKKVRCGVTLACGTVTRRSLLGAPLCPLCQLSSPQETDPGLLSADSCPVLQRAAPLPGRLRLTRASVRSSSHPFPGLKSSPDCVLPPRLTSWMFKWTPDPLIRSPIDKATYPALCPALTTARLLGTLAACSAPKAMQMLRPALASGVDTIAQSFLSGFPSYDPEPQPRPGPPSPS